MTTTTKTTTTSTTSTTTAPSLFQSVVLGGVSCIFTVNFTHPIELIKTRMQVSGSKVLAEIASTYSKEGILAFWKGIVWAYGREGSYAAIKIGGYAPIRDMLGAGDVNSPGYLKFAAGGITGAVGSVVGNPFDVLKTLSQTNKDKSIPLQQLVQDMYQNQGVAGFYRGVSVNVMRACVLSASQMGVYDISKGYVVDWTGWGRKDLKTVFTCAILSGFFMTITVSPFDRIRTELMNQPVKKTTKLLYTGFSDCAIQIVQKNGILTLWRAFMPIWIRFAPSATIQLVTIEALYTMFGFKSI